MGKCSGGRVARAAAFGIYRLHAELYAIGYFNDDFRILRVDGGNHRHMVRDRIGDQ